MLRFGFLIGVGVECVIRLEVRKLICYARPEAFSARIIPTGADVDDRLRVLDVGGGEDREITFTECLLCAYKHLTCGLFITTL